MSVTGSHPDFGFQLTVIGGLILFAIACVAFLFLIAFLQEKNKPGCVLIVVAIPVILVSVLVLNIVSCVSHEVHGTHSSNVNPQTGELWNKKHN